MKKKKIFTITSIVLLSSFILYFFGGLGLFSLGSVLFINQRYSDVSKLDIEDFYNVQKVRRDFSSLANREEFTFDSNGQTLQAYYYASSEPKGTILFAHGVNNMADGNMAQMQDYFLRNNYDVFSFDLTGCGRSSGPGIINLHESRYCVRNAINMVKTKQNGRNLPLFLLGHSWGAYGVVSASGDVEGVSAVTSISAYNNPSEMMRVFGEPYASSFLMNLMRPSLDFSLAMLYGQDAFYNAESTIINNPNIHYMVIHGEKDDLVRLVGASLYDNIKDDHYSNVTPILLEGVGHGAPWKTIEADRLMLEAEANIKALRNELGPDFTEEVRQEFLSHIDKDKTSTINETLLHQIDEFFMSSI